MKVEIIEKTENPLFKRTEVRFKADHAGEPTPKRLDARAQLAAQLGVAEELIVIEKLASTHGRQVASGIARVYSSREQLEGLEPKFLLERDMPKEAKAKAKPEEKPKVEKPPEKKVEEPKEAKPEEPKVEKPPEKKVEEPKEAKPEEPKVEKPPEKKVEEPKEAKPEEKPKEAAKPEKPEAEEAAEAPEGAKAEEKAKEAVEGGKEG